MNRDRLVEAFLDEVAEYFDRELPLAPEAHLINPADGKPITARRMLELIRLGK